MELSTLEILANIVGAILGGLIFMVLWDIFIESFVLRNFTTTTKWWIPAIGTFAAHALNREYYWAVMAALLAAFGAGLWWGFKCLVARGSK